MRTVDLEGLHVTLDQPAVVAAQQGRCWFPQLERFPSGELFAGFSIAPDEVTAGALVPNYSGGVCVSRDGGTTWEGHYPAFNYGGGKCILPDGTMLCMAHAARFYPEGQARDCMGIYVLYTHGGRRIIRELDGMRMVGIPRDLQMAWTGRPSLHAASEILPSGGERLLTLAYSMFVGDSLRSLLTLTSDDLGHTWRYVSTVATPADTPGAPEGPNEAAVVRLASGDLLCVFRVGSQEPFHKAYSADEGKTWSPVEVMDGPYSVKPALVRLQSGVLALTGGRSGIFLWLCTDGHGDRWQAVDIVAHHNAVMDAPHHIRLNPERRHDPEQPEQSTSYTGMVELTPNEVLVLYDRTPFGWRPVPKDSPELSRVYALRIGIAKT
jgi:hypothetical protein